jgi:hypothetical protein
MSLVINGSGSITGLAVGGLPDGTVDAGTLATDSVTAAKLEVSAITGADLPAGSVLQVVQATSTTQVTTTSASYQTTGVAASINVTSGNKVLITGVLNAVGPTAVLTGTTVAIFRGSTQIFQPAEYAGYNTHSTNHTQPIPLDYLDASAGSGDVTYTVKYKRRSGSGTARAMVDSAMSRIILTEIAG